MAYSGDVKPKAESLARKGEGRMKDEAFNAIVRDALAEARQFVDTELSPERARATRYYQGKPFGNEEEGRSQAILTEVRDASDGMTPDLVRIAVGAEHAVEFAPTRPDNVEQAEQKTDFVRYVFEQESSGLLETLSVIKDGLIRKIGIFKWGWDASHDTKAYKMEGLAPEEVDALASDDSITLSRVLERTDGLRDVELTRTENTGRVWVKSLPPEEFLYNRDARSIEEASLVAHRTTKTRGQLLAMGVSKKAIEEHGGAGEENERTQNFEEIARRDIGGVGVSVGATSMADPDLGKATDKILYCEAYATIDYDGDGIAELRRICTIGPNYHPVSNDPDDDRPFSLFTPYPEPHALLGGSVADRTMDVQKINSALLRGTLDSLSISLFPRPVYIEGQANVADIMNTAIGQPIRERIAGAVRWTEVPFAGEKVLPILGFMKGVVEGRTGNSKGAAGLDMDALQSTGKEAANAVLTGNQAQLELIARVLAEMALKPMFAGIGRLLNKHQPRERMIRLRGKWVTVDPRSWDANMDVIVNVALGSAFTDKKIAVLMGVASDQHEILTTMGLVNPLVTLAQYRNTRAKILNLHGIKDVDNYYQPVPDDWQPPAPPQPQEDPWVTLEREMNHQKTMKELAIKQDELALKLKTAEWDHDFAIQKLAADTAMKKYAADASNHATMSSAAVNAAIQEQATETELAMAAHDQLHDQELEMSQHEHDKEMAVRAADTADTADTAAAQPPSAE